MKTDKGRVSSVSPHTVLSGLGAHEMIVRDNDCQIGLFNLSCTDGVTVPSELLDRFAVLLPSKAVDNAPAALEKGTESNSLLVLPSF